MSALSKPFVAWIDIFQESRTVKKETRRSPPRASHGTTRSRPLAAMATKSATSRPRRVCFVTTGATASFDSLIEAVLSPAFLDALSAVNYTHLTIQHGTSGRLALAKFEERLEQGQTDTHGLSINSFAFNKIGLGQEMRAAKGGNDAVEGVVVSHAGRSCFVHVSLKA